MTVFDTLETMPERVTSGDSVSIALKAMSSIFPPAAYALKVIMKLGANQAIEVDLADDSGIHTGTLNFANAPAGDYAYSIRATRSADNAVRTVATGTVIVLPDPVTADTRSHAEKVLEAIEALIEGRATKDVSSYSIAGRSLTRLTPDELVKWRSFYKNEVAIQRAAGKPNGGRRIRLASFH